MKQAFAVLCAAVALCGCGPSVSDIEKQSKPIVEQIIQQNDALKNLGLAVEKIDAIKEGDGKYKGLATITLDGKSYTAPLQITANSEKIFVETPPGAFGFAAQKIMSEAMKHPFGQ